MSTVAQVIPRISDCKVTELAQILEEAVNAIGDFVHLSAEYEKVQLLLERSSLNLGGLFPRGGLNSLVRVLLVPSLAKSKKSIYRSQMR